VKSFCLFWDEKRLVQDGLGWRMMVFWFRSILSEYSIFLMHNWFLLMFLIYRLGNLCFRNMSICLHFASHFFFLFHNQIYPTCYNKNWFCYFDIVNFLSHYNSPFKFFCGFRWLKIGVRYFFYCFFFENNHVFIFILNLRFIHNKKK
jgi:hypothetical protein